MTTTDTYTDLLRSELQSMDPATYTLLRDTVLTLGDCDVHIETLVCEHDLPPQVWQQVVAIRNAMEALNEQLGNFSKAGL